MQLFRMLFVNYLRSEQERNLSHNVNVDIDDVILNLKLNKVYNVFNFYLIIRYFGVRIQLCENYLKNVIILLEND
jgi:cytochrome c biogenesis protein ResB